MSRRKGKQADEEKPHKEPTFKNTLLATGLKDVRKQIEAEEQKKLEEKKKQDEAKKSANAKSAARSQSIADIPGAGPKGAAYKPGEEVWRPDLEADLMRIAMAGVKPLDPKGNEKRPAAAASKPAASNAATSAVKVRRAHAEGDDGLEVRHHDGGTVEAARKGRSFALEALGRFAVPQDTLDLHGCVPSEAVTKVVDFVRSRRARGLRTVCVVHGVGKHSPDGVSVLRDVVIRALSEPPGSREVDAFASSGEVGRKGALMVALRSGK